MDCKINPAAVYWDEKVDKMFLEMKGGKSWNSS